MRRGLRDCGVLNPCVVASDGLKALELLRGNGTGLSRPYLILLDLNLPRLSGLELLSQLRADPQLRDSLVFVLTTSDDERDKRAAYQHNVAGYLLKSGPGDSFRRSLLLVRHYLSVVEFPPSQ